jgi:hypothetical protein
MIVRAMVVLVMLVVMMPVLVLHRFVKVLVLVPFSQVQPESDAHKAVGQAGGPAAPHQESCRTNRVIRAFAQQP